MAPRADGSQQILLAWTVWGLGVVLLARAYRHRGLPRGSGMLLPL